MGVQTLMNDISAQLEQAFPIALLAAASTCRAYGVDAVAHSELLAVDAIEVFWMRWTRKQEEYSAFLATPALAFSVFRQLTAKQLSKKLHSEARIQSLDAQELEHALQEIEWGNVSKHAVVSHQRGKRVHWVPLAATDEEIETLAAGLAKRSWGGLEYLDVVAIVRQSRELQEWLRGYSRREIGNPATTAEALQTLRNQI